MSTEMNLRVSRGETLISGKIFKINEVLPEGITYEELLAGIQAGTYTRESLVGRTYAGQVRARAGAAVRGNLSFTVVDNVLAFSLAASITKDFPDDEDVLFYDVMETITATGEVRKRVHGKIFVDKTITQIG